MWIFCQQINKSFSNQTFPSSTLVLGWGVGEMLGYLGCVCFVFEAQGLQFPPAKFNTSPLKRYLNYPNRKGLSSNHYFSGENSLLNFRGVVHHHSSTIQKWNPSGVATCHSKTKRNSQFSNLQYPHDIPLYWVVYRDPCLGLLKSICNWVVFHPHIIQPTRVNWSLLSCVVRLRQRFAWTIFGVLVAVFIVELVVVLVELGPEFLSFLPYTNEK